MKICITCVSLIQKTAVVKIRRRQKVLGNNNNLISSLRSLSQERVTAVVCGTAAWAPHAEKNNKGVFYREKAPRTPSRRFSSFSAATESSCVWGWWRRRVRATRYARPRPNYYWTASTFIPGSRATPRALSPYSSPPASALPQSPFAGCRLRCCNASASRRPRSQRSATNSPSPGPPQALHIDGRHYVAADCHPGALCPGALWPQVERLHALAVSL